MPVNTDQPTTTRPNAVHIAVIDNGICNLRSVTKALENVGGDYLLERHKI